MNEPPTGSKQIPVPTFSGLPTPYLKWGLAIVAVIATVAVVLVALPRMLGTNSLRFTEPEEAGIVRFVDDNGEVTGTFYTRLDNVTGEAPRLVVQVPFEDGYELDSISMRFTPQEHMPVSLTAASYDVDYRLTLADLHETIFEVPDLGVYGVGTITLRFILGDSAATSPFGLSFDVLRHRTSYPYQKQQLKSSLELMPG